MTDIDKAIEEAKAAVMPFESWERLPGKRGRLTPPFARTGITDLNGISARRWKPRNMTGPSGKSGTGCGGTGLPNSAGGNGLRNMTATRLWNGL
jgi:hypothetical protein